MKTRTQQHQFARVCTNTIILFFLSISLIFGQDEDVTECPYFNVFCTDSTGVAFSLVSTDIDATISGVIANVIIEQTYLNTGDSIIDATYVFPMSTNAAVYDMEMIINGRTIQAVIKRKDEAQEIFDNANEAGLTASLLEQERPNVFQMSLANINPGDTLKVRMKYTELMIPKKSVYQFVFPSIVGPRYTTYAESWVFQSILDSIPLLETDLNIDLKINAGMQVHADCKSHDVTFDIQDNTAQTQLRTNPGADFIVDYTLDRNQIETGLLLYEGEDENFFLSIIQPPKPNVSFSIPKREYIFIMDISGSMTGEPLEVSKSLIINLLSDLNYDDKFNIIFFASGTAELSPDPLPVTDENIDLAIQMIENLSAGGSTNLLPAMQRALNMKGDTEEYSRSFVILTDGYVTVEKEAFELIRQNLHEANFFAFGIGSSINRYIIEGIAYVGEGEPFMVTDDVDADEMAETFKEYIERPALTNIKTAFEGIDVYDVEPLSIPDVFAERPIIVYGKYHKLEDGNITITGDYGDGNIISSLAFSDYKDNTEENIAIKYLWARKRINLMSDYGIASNESDTISIEEEITQLGLKYSLVTEFTSFVAVDSNAVTDTSQDPPNDDGGLSITNEINTGPSNKDKNLIKILGIVSHSDNVLRLQLENIDVSEYEDLFLEITSLNGKSLMLHHLKEFELGMVIRIPLDQLPSGFYFASLTTKSEILDTEKFVVVN